MGAEKGGTKSGGFFHLFDWNRKSRKKLFANGIVSAEGVRKGANGDDNEHTNRISLIEDDDTGGISSMKGSSDYSCASSVTDEDGNGIRAPGVVARLMGLDSLPGVGIPEPYSTPLSNARSLRENNYQKRSLVYHIDDQFSNAGGSSECFYRKPLDLRCHKMPSSPIERFQTEALPPRSAKSLPITHYKLLSPIKNPRFFSGKNGAHIMEAAAKILEPGLHVNAKEKVLSLGSTPLTLKVQGSKENSAVSIRSSKLPESSVQPLESNAVNYLKGHSLNKSWNGSNDASSMVISPRWEETSSTSVKGRGKSISLAIQAKVNVQKREGLSTSTRGTTVPREQDGAKQNQPFKSQLSSKNKTQKKSSTAGPSSVLKQNNQKQNCLSTKDKSTAKPSMSNQQVRKVPSVDANTGKNRTLNKAQGSSKVGYKKEESQVSDCEDAFSSRTKGTPRKKRLIDGSFQSDRSTLSDNILADRHEKCFQPSVVIDEHQRCDEDNIRNGTDVVSFTFTSPMIKQQPGSCTTHVTGENDINSFSVGLQGERNDADVESRNLSLLSLNTMNGDALSILLERKLKELTSGFDSYSNLVKVDDRPVSALFSLDLASTSENSHTVPMLCDKKATAVSCRTNSESDGSLLFNSRLVNNLRSNLQRVEGIAECSSSSSSNACKEPERPSPLSILEVSFSNESCNSSDSSDSTIGSKICSSGQAQNNTDSKPSGEAEADNSDSASSYMENANKKDCANFIAMAGPAQTWAQESEYVRDILWDVNLNFEVLSLGCSDHTLDPLLFDQLENKRNRRRTKGAGGTDSSRLWRKMLFDCVSECLESKQSRYFRAGYQTWAKGVAAIAGRMDELAEEAYREICGWKGMGDWMVDELVDRDMSSHLGRWLDFEAEGFEAGVEIQKELLSDLVDEVVDDFIM